MNVIEVLSQKVAVFPDPHPRPPLTRALALALLSGALLLLPGPVAAQQGET